MARPKIVEVEYHEFNKQRKIALDKGNCLSKTDGSSWDEYVTAHGVNEVAMASWGRSKFESSKLAIIDSGGKWDGYYVYSEDDEACLKWTLGGA